MNRRIRKKKDKPIYEICKTIKSSHGESFWKSLKDVECDGGCDPIDVAHEKDTIKMHNMLLFRIVKRCYSEGFPIQDYFIFDIPYGDREGCIFDFVHIGDFEDYHDQGICDKKIRCIDFFVRRTGSAVPLRLDGSIQHFADSCQEALYESD